MHTLCKKLWRFKPKDPRTHRRRRKLDRMIVRELLKIQENLTRSLKEVYTDYLSFMRPQRKENGPKVYLMINRVKMMMLSIQILKLLKISMTRMFLRR